MVVMFHSSHFIFLIYQGKGILWCRVLPVMCPKLNENMAMMATEQPMWPLWLGNFGDFKCQMFCICTGPVLYLLTSGVPSVAKICMMFEIILLHNFDT